MNWLRLAIIALALAAAALAALVPQTAPYATPAAAFLFGYFFNPPGSGAPQAPKATAMLILAGGLALPWTAWADQVGTPLPLLPGTLGCFAGGKHCGRLSVPIGVVGFRARDGAMGQVGFFPTVSAVLGLDLWATKWYTLSPGIGGSAVKSTDGSSTTASVGAVLGIARYVTVGVSARWGEWRDVYVLYSVDPMALASLALPAQAPPAKVALREDEL